MRNENPTTGDTMTLTKRDLGYIQPDTLEAIREFTVRYGYTDAHYAPDVANFFSIPVAQAARIIRFFHGD